MMQSPISTFLIVLLIAHTNAVDFTDFHKSFPNLVKDYEALPASAQTIAQDEIRNMGHYDAPRTRLSGTGKYFIVEDAVNATAAGAASVQRRLVSGTAPTYYTSRGYESSCIMAIHSSHTSHAHCSLAVGVNFIVASIMN